MDLISYVSKLEEKGVGFHSISEAINTETPSGKFMFHVSGALSEFERLVNDLCKLFPEELVNAYNNIDHTKKGDRILMRKEIEYK